MDARPGGPAVKTSAQHGRAGNQSEVDLSAVGAALNLVPPPPVSLDRSRETCGLFLSIRSDGTYQNHRPSLCHPAQSTCLLQVEKEMTLQNRDGCEARRAGRQNFSPAREGWESIRSLSERRRRGTKPGPTPPCVLGPKPRDLRPFSVYPI